MALPFPASERGTTGLAAHLSTPQTFFPQQPPRTRDTLQSRYSSSSEMTSTNSYTSKITAFFSDRRVLKTIGAIPVIILLFIFTFAYYGYVIAMVQLTPQEQQGSAEVFKLIGFHILFALTLVSLGRAIFTHPGTPSNNPLWDRHSEGPTSPMRIEPTEFMHDRRRTYSSESISGPVQPMPDARFCGYTPARLADPAEGLPTPQTERQPFQLSQEPTDTTQDMPLYPLFKDAALTDGTYQPPAHWRASRTMSHRHSNSLSAKTVTVKYDGRPRYCRKCDLPKPDRSHHCRICQQCILKMDHHCPWLNNCVGHHNYKFFILFLTWTSVLCLYIFATSLHAFIWAIQHRRYPVMPLELNMERNIAIAYLLLAGGMFGIFLSCFAGYHMHLTMKNKTNLESMDSNHLRTRFSPPEVTGRQVVNMFDLGRWKNWQQVFGTRWWLWLLPIHTTLGDGLSYPINEKAYRSVPALDNI